MAAARQRFVHCASPRGLHRMAYWEWGPAQGAQAVVCVHGLTRCARDFDALAGALAERYRVVCPDVVGRGDSDWLPDPMLYALPQYVADMVTLVARLDVEGVQWVGTSMGGLIGMALAAQPGTPVRKLVLNDVGPVIAKAALGRIATYVGGAPTFPGFEAAQAYVRAVSAPFGPHSEAQWRFLAEVVLRRNADGSYRLHYDPAIAEPVRAQRPEADLELWPLYDAVRCPTLALRGALSDRAASDTWQAMAARGPQAQLAEIPGVGHAPTLLQPEQIALVRDFLLAG